MKSTLTIWGKQAVREAARADLLVDRLFVYEKLEQKEAFLQSLGDHNLLVREVGRQQLRDLAGTDKTGGVVAEVAPPEPKSLPRVLRRLAERNRTPCLIVLDHVEDPQNLGAIFRIADTVGADGVIVTRRRCAPITGSAVHASAGAIFHVPVIQVANIAAALDMMREARIWTVGAMPEGDREYTEVEYTMPVAIVLGSEGRGIRPVVGRKCDFLVRIPMSGRVASLNVAQSAAVLLYEVVRQRRAADRS